MGHEFRIWVILPRLPCSSAASELWVIYTFMGGFCKCHSRNHILPLGKAGLRSYSDHHTIFDFSFLTWILLAGMLFGFGKEGFLCCLAIAIGLDQNLSIQMLLPPPFLTTCVCVSAICLSPLFLHLFQVSMKSVCLVSLVVCVTTVTLCFPPWSGGVSLPQPFRTWMVENWGLGGHTSLIL